MDVVLAIPRLIVELVLYLGDVLFLSPGNLVLILGLTTPLALGALCGVLCERSGVVNIGIEGIMLNAAFFGYLTGWALHEQVGDGAALALGTLVAVVVGLLMGVVHAWLSVTIRADQIIAGVFLNVFAFGLTSFLNRLIITPSGRGGAGVMPTLELIPAPIVEVPVIGPILAMFFNQNPIALSLLFIVLVSQFLLFRSRWGLRTRAVGEHPKAADTLGVNVFRLRYLNVIVGCGLAGLAGAYMTLASTGSFQNGMSGGRGFIALAAMIFGRWTPLGAFGGALLFGAATGVQLIVGVDPPTGELGDIMRAIPSFWYAAFPYLLTIVILAGVVGRSIPPAADGIPYEKEARA